MNNDIERLYVAFKKIGEQEQEVFKSFFDRLNTIKEHKKLIANLVWWSRQLRDASDLSNIFHIKSEIEKIRRQIFSKFQSILDYEKKEYALLLEEKTLTAKEESILSKEWRDFLEAKENEALNSIAVKKIGLSAKKISQALEKEHEEDSLADQILHILDKFEIYINDQKLFLQKEDEVFQWYEHLSEINKDQIRAKEEELEEIIYAIILSLYKEKNECLAPLQNIFEKKRTVKTQIHDLITRKMMFFSFSKKTVITLSDVKEDLRTFTKPEEVLEYQSLLMEHSDMLDDPCKKTLSRYSLRSLWLSLREKKELAAAALEALIDQLTNCFTKKYFWKKIPELIQRASKDSSQLCLLVFDGDNFKRINDTYGHAVGDNVLRFLGNTSRKALKAKDLVFRYGGEEFCVIFSPADFHEIVGVVNRLRLLIEKESPIFFKRIGIDDKFTISGGLAFFNGKGKLITIENADQLSKKLFEIADAALYEAKRRGKNHIQIIQEYLTN